MTMTMESTGNILNKKKWQPKLDSFEGLPIRPPVKQTRLYLDNEYFEKGYAAAFPDSATAVYCILAKYAHHEKQICFPAAKTIMELDGITNRSTVFRAFKILEAYNIIAIIHRSKGRVPNVYALLAPSHWTSLNSLPFETVIQRIKKPRTVSVKQGQQSQNPPHNSGTDETRSHITESNKEIKDGLKKSSIKGTELLQRLSPASKSLLTNYFSKEDMVAALEEIVASDAKADKLGYKPVLESLRRRGAALLKELPGWIR